MLPDAARGACRSWVPRTPDCLPPIGAPPGHCVGRRGAPGAPAWSDGSEGPGTDLPPPPRLRLSASRQATKNMWRAAAGRRVCACHDAAQARRAPAATRHRAAAVCCDACVRHAWPSVPRPAQPAGPGRTCMRGLPAVALLSPPCPGGGGGAGLCVVTTVLRVAASRRVAPAAATARRQRATCQTHWGRRALTTLRLSELPTLPQVGDR